MDDKWIDRMRDKMVEYEVVPPDGLLESVRDDIRSRMIKKRRVWWSIAASIALLGGIFAAVISEKIDKSIPLIVDVGEVDRHSEKGSFDQSSEKAVFTATTLSRQMIPSSQGGAVLAFNNGESTGSVKKEDFQVEADAYPEDSNKTDTESGNYSLPETEDYDVDTFSKKERVSESSLSVGVAASANGLGSLLNAGDIDGSSMHSSSLMPSTRMGGGVLTESPSNAAPSPTFVEMFDHKLPARFSIDFSWSVGHNLNVGTGICYSYLRSDIKYGYSDSPLLKASQNLHFIGVPVNVRYTPWRYRKFEFYTSIGFMAEKCIWGEIKEESPSNSGYRYAGCDERPFQFSFNAAAGLQYALTHKCALFVEPGVGMYINNGSRLRTIYSARPLTFNVNVGLRLGN